MSMIFILKIKFCVAKVSKLIFFRIASVRINKFSPNIVPQTIVAAINAR